MAVTPDEIGRVIRLGEDSENEFKSVRHGLPRADDAAQTIVAFANAAGGRVVPSITCRHVKAEHLGELLIVTEVPPRPPGRPYRTQRGIHYVRGAASVRIASPDEIRRLVLSAGATALVADGSRSLEQRSTTSTPCTSGSTIARSTAKSCLPTGANSCGSSPTFAS